MEVEVEVEVEVGMGMGMEKEEAAINNLDQDIADNYGPVANY